MTTLSATALIILKIILVAKHSPVRSSYQRIIEIIFELAALSSTILLLDGAIQLRYWRGRIDLSTKLGLAEVELLNYAGAITGAVLVGISSLRDNT